ncbi:MAG: hypothetical protein J5605_09530, partial [Bacteroidales bacterium]|nr:hypothetical protein [Bacteroidales bacterium]
MRKIISILIMSLMAYVAWAQAPTYKLDATNNGQSITITSEGAFLYDDGGMDNPYTSSKDFSITFCGTCQLNAYRMGFTFLNFDIDPGDTIFVYDGPSTSDRLLIKANNSNSMLNKRVYPTTSNTSGCLTVRFKSNDDNNRGEGFEINIICGYPCENSYPVIEDTYYKVVDGQNIPLRTKFTYEIDTTDTGIEGIATALAARSGNVTEAYIHDNIAPVVLGRSPYDHEKIWHELWNIDRHLTFFPVYLPGPIDVALWDICAKAAG